MGITGLLPFLKKCSRNIHIKDFRGYTAAIDVYCWIHRASYTCAMDLALKNHTDQFVRYCMRFLQIILDAEIKPILVFDGANLPAKSNTELKRRNSKKAYREKAAQYLLEGNRKAAQMCFERCVDVTPEMAHAVMQAARKLGVDCIVAPYESDAQLAYLSQAGYADLVITEDSDLLLFGCKQVIFKLDMSGSGVLITWSSGIGERCCGIQSENFSVDTLRYIGILSGCDYFPGIPKIGVATAAKILRQSRSINFESLLQTLGNYFNLTADTYLKMNKHTASEETETDEGDAADESDNFLNASDTVSSPVPALCKNNLHRTDSTRRKFVSSSCRSNGEVAVKKLPPKTILDALRADRTFRLQVVFDPRTRKRRRLSEPTAEDVAAEKLLFVEDDDLNKSICLFSYAGDDLIDPLLAYDIALGNVNFLTGKRVDTFQPSTCNIRQSIKSNNPNSTLTPHHISMSSVHGDTCEVTSFSQLTSTLHLNPIVRPDPKRLNNSIWQPDYPLQPVWLHYTNSVEGRSRPIFLSLELTHDSPQLASALMTIPSLDPSSNNLPTSLSPIDQRVTCRQYKQSKVEVVSTNVFPKDVAVISSDSSIQKRNLKRNSTEDQDMFLTNSAKISKVLDSYDCAIDSKSSPFASHWRSETPITTAGAYFQSPVSELLSSESTENVNPTSSDQHTSPIFAQKSPSMVSNRPSINRFAVMRKSPQDELASHSKLIDSVPSWNSNVLRQSGTMNADHAAKPRSALATLSMNSRISKAFSFNPIRQNVRQVNSTLLRSETTSKPSKLVCPSSSDSLRHSRSPIYTDDFGTSAQNVDSDNEQNISETSLVAPTVTSRSLSAHFSNWKFKPPRNV